MLGVGVLCGVGAVETVDTVGPQHPPLLHAAGYGDCIRLRMRPPIAARVKNSDVVNNLTGELEQAVDVSVVFAVNSAFLGEIEVYVSDDVCFVADGRIQNLDRLAKFLTQQTLALLLLVTLHKIEHEDWAAVLPHQLAEMECRSVVQGVKVGQGDWWLRVETVRRLAPEQRHRRAKLQEGRVRYR